MCPPLDAGGEKRTRYFLQMLTNTLLKYVGGGGGAQNIKRQNKTNENVIYM